MMWVLSLSPAHILLFPLHAWLLSYIDQFKFWKYQSLFSLRAFILPTSSPRNTPCSPLLTSSLALLPSPPDPSKLLTWHLLANPQVSASMSPPQRGPSGPLYFCGQLPN